LELFDNGKPQGQTPDVINRLDQIDANSAFNNVRNAAATVAASFAARPAYAYA
jgi:hypothetical protein